MTTALVAHNGTSMFACAQICAGFADSYFTTAHIDINRKG